MAMQETAANSQAQYCTCHESSSILLACVNSFQAGKNHLPLRISMLGNDVSHISIPHPRLASSNDFMQTLQQAASLATDQCQALWTSKTPKGANDANKACDKWLSTPPDAAHLQGLVCV